MYEGLQAVTNTVGSKSWADPKWETTKACNASERERREEREKRRGEISDLRKPTPLPSDSFTKLIEVNSLEFLPQKPYPWPREIAKNNINNFILSSRRQKFLRNYLK